VVVHVKLVVGLGNPGELYHATRHNIGYLVIDYLAQYYQIALCTRHLNALLGHGVIGDNDILLVKPDTFMNLSGDAVQAIACFYQLSAEDIIVIHDDIDLEFGRIKITATGGSGGHRGVASICAALQKGAFIRIRIGIGRPPPDQGATEFVLQPFTDAEQHQLAAIIKSTAQCLDLVLSQGLTAAMNTFRKKTSFPPH
jgi:PTH1 family peptidyl-tRNA hydrolase